MSGSRVIVTKRQPVIMGHVCSCCGSPVLSTVLIEARVQKTYMFSMSKAEEIAEETAEQEIQDGIKRIETCKRTRYMLVPKVKESKMIEPGHFSDASMSGLDSKCPNCLNYEPWQPLTGAKKKLGELEDDNFPNAFSDYKEAETWALNYNQRMINRIESIRASIDDVETAKKDAIRLYSLIENMKQQRDSLPELAQRDTLKAEYDLLEKQKANIGLLDFSGRKALNDKKKVISLRLNDVNSYISDAQRNINLQIIGKQVMLDTIQAIAYGCTGKSLVKKLGIAVSVQIEANRIPRSDIETYAPISTNRHEPDQIRSMESYYMMIKSQSVEVDQSAEVGQSLPDAIDVTVSEDGMIVCQECGFKQKDDRTICFNCGHPFSFEKNAPLLNCVDVVPDKNGIVVCPVCGSRQKAERTACFNCNQPFRTKENAQDSTPLVASPALKEKAPIIEAAPPTIKTKPPIIETTPPIMEEGNPTTTTAPPTIKYNMPAGDVCQKCGSKLLEDSMFCSACGTPIEKPTPKAPKVMFCRKCGSKLLADSAFCTKCGTKIAIIK